MKSAYVGMLGDVVSFVGAFVLALDALWARRDYDRRQYALRHLIDPNAKSAEIGVMMDGRILMRPEDIELIAVDKTFHRAVVGFIILSLGLLCIFCSRILGFYNL